MPATEEEAQGSALSVFSRLALHPVVLTPLAAPGGQALVAAPAVVPPPLSQRLCAACSKPASQSCPVCIKIGLPWEYASYCSKACLSKLWSSHKLMHLCAMPGCNAQVAAPFFCSVCQDMHLPCRFFCSEEHRVQAWRAKTHDQVHLDMRTRLDTADFCYDSARSLRAQDSHAAAIIQYYQGMQIAETVYFTRNSSEIARIMRSVAKAHLVMGKQDEALLKFSTALAIREGVLGPAHPKCATALCNIGDILLKQGKADEALAKYEQALDIREQALGRQHAKVATSLQKCAEALRALGRDEDAQRKHDEAAELLRGTLAGQRPAFLLE